MCLAVPALIEEIDEYGMALVKIENIQIGHVTVTDNTQDEDNATRLKVSIALLPSPPQIGDYVIIHAGFAINSMNKTEAEKTLSLLREMAAAVSDTIP